MTLIVGFRCGESSVLCADSQETSGDLKSEINKLQIYRAKGRGSDLVCAGAGNGELTDALRAQLVATMTSSGACGEETVRNELESVLVKFHKSEVFSAFPATKEDDKYIAGLIAVWPGYASAQECIHPLKAGTLIA